MAMPAMAPAESEGAGLGVDDGLRGSEVELEAVESEAVELSQSDLTLMREESWFN